MWSLSVRRPRPHPSQEPVGAGPLRPRRARGLAATLAAAVVLTGLLADAQPGAAAKAKPTSVATGRCLALGIGSNYQWGSTAGFAAQDLPKIKRDGLSWVREDIFWNTVQPTDAQHWNWDVYDRLFTTMAQLNVHVLPIISYGTTWSSPDGQIRDIPRTTSGQQAYARFAAAVVTRYGPNGAFWRAHRALRTPVPIGAVELWNEPWFAPHPALEPYIQIVRDAGAAVHRVDPDILVAVNADDRAYALQGNTYLYWGQELIKQYARIASFVDRWAIHPYSAGQWTGLSPAADSMRQITWLQNLLAAAHAPGLIWITEVGFSSAPPPEDSKGYHSYQSTEPSFVTFLRDAARTTGPNRVTRTWLFTSSRPNSSTRPGSWDYGFNLVDAGGRLAPALASVAKAACSG